MAVTSSATDCPELKPSSALHFVTKLNLSKLANHTGSQFPRGQREHNINVYPRGMTRSNMQEAL